MHFPVKWASLLIPPLHLLWSACIPVNLRESILLKSFRSLAFYFLTYFLTTIGVRIKPLWQTSLAVFLSLPILWSSLLDSILHTGGYSGWTWKGRSFSFLLRQSKAFESLLISSLRNAYTRGFSVELAKCNKRNASISCLDGTQRLK